MKPLKKLWDITPAVIIGKKLKQSADQRKLAKVNAPKPVKPIKLSGEYFSSHPAIHGVSWLEIHLLPDGVQVYAKKLLIKKFEWSEITGYENETEDKTNLQATQRLTATRMATMGIFSLAAPKKQTHGNVNSKFYDLFHTTTGDIELETKIAGGGSGTLGDLSRSTAELFIMKREAKTKEIRRFVSEHVVRNTP